MKILILGAGAIGGYFGGRLLQSGADVTFLVREKRRAQLERDGLRIESPCGNATLAVRSILAQQLRPEYDAIILTCKSYDLDSALDSIAPRLSPSGFVLPLLNGIAHMQVLNQRFGRERVLGGTAAIMVGLTSEGVVQHLGDWRYITFGEQGDVLTERVRNLAAAFPSASVEARAVANVMQEMWEKFVNLGSGASMTCLMRANLGEIVRTADGARLCARMLDTLAAIATCNGYPPGEKHMATFRTIFSDPQAVYSTSMLRDIESGNRTEGDHIVGFALAKAREAGIDASLLEVAYTHIKSYENRRAAGRLPG